MVKCFFFISLTTVSNTQIFSNNRETCTIHFKTIWTIFPLQIPEYLPSFEANVQLSENDWEPLVQILNKVWRVLVPLEKLKLKGEPFSVNGFYDCVAENTRNVYSSTVYMTVEHILTIMYRVKRYACAAIICNKFPVPLACSLTCKSFRDYFTIAPAPNRSHYSFARSPYLHFYRKTNLSRG